MRTRPRSRALILFLTLSVCLLGQEAPLPSGVYLIAPAASVHQIQLPGQPVVHLSAALTVKDARMHSTSNANSVFNLYVHHTSPPPCTGAILQLDRDTIRSNGGGSGQEGCSVLFTLTAEHATRAAAFFGTTRNDRKEVGERLRATFSVTDNRQLVVRIENPPDAPAVYWEHGGRNRGPRDNQFSMRLTRDGQALTPVGAFDFGGLMTMPLLQPGGFVELSAPISSWGDVSVPGRYVVEAAYETALAPFNGDLMASPRMDLAWARRFEGTASFEVR
jgi:hypothetical protein